MFRHLPRAEHTVRIYVNGQPVQAVSSDTVATALLIAGITTFRETPVSGAPRAPYCGMGVCFECLVTIDGQANRQACLVPVSEEMKVETKSASGPIAVEHTS